MLLKLTEKGKKLSTDTSGPIKCYQNVPLDVLRTTHISRLGKHGNH